MNPTSVFPLDTLFDLTDRVALITGAANGIGQLACKVLAQAGAHIVATDLDITALAELVTSLREAGLSAESKPMDVSDEAGVCACFQDVGQRLGRLDILLNCAGTAQRTPSIDTPLEVWNRVLNVNLTGTFLCCREAARIMQHQGGGSIINLSSIMGHSGGGLYPNPSYHASKGGIVNLTRALAAEWGGLNIRVNDIAPTFVNTRFAAKVINDPVLRPAIEQQTPLGRIAEVEDLAGAILYLASPASSMVTGHSLAVDGGFLAR